ncbi:hypothetical protein Taro_036696 [Colocasia esculenta]|uniref:Uncharacterized protein n=1 Tax=Colocasia esculenta TaxID=4460 RepID=A0A843WMF7_COLES|nr:hypothetical protein [Colocasia esculenta]
MVRSENKNRICHDPEERGGAAPVGGQGGWQGRGSASGMAIRGELERDGAALVGGRGGGRRVAPGRDSHVGEPAVGDPSGGARCIVLR